MTIKTDHEGLILTTDFTREDIDYCIKRHLEIYSEEFGLSQNFFDNVVTLVNEFYDEYDAETDFMLVARDNGRFAGTITMIGEDDGNARLRFFFVEPFTRGKGVGKLLFTTAMQLSKEMGYSHAYFSTFNINKVARTMYRKLGFRITDEERAEEFGHGVIEETWEKDL